MKIKIALAGNPNSGKTTLFNALTGSNQFVGNWPGVTVEKKEGKLKKYNDVVITDLPGIYSLSPYTLEEVVARNYLIGEKPDVILNIVDGTNLERNLYLTTQLLELGIPVVIAINMMDVVHKNGDKINTKELSHQLGCKVVEISALKSNGIIQAAEIAIEEAQKGKMIAKSIFSEKIEQELKQIEKLALTSFLDEQKRWYAIKLFERDDKVIEQLKLNAEVSQQIEEKIVQIEKELDDDAESIITNERYVYIEKIIKDCYHKKSVGKMSTSDKIDRIVTNRWLGLPIFAIIVFLVYFISMVSVGQAATDWANDGVFGDGYHLLGIGSSAYEEASTEYHDAIVIVDGYDTYVLEFGQAPTDKFTYEIQDEETLQITTQEATIADYHDALQVVEKYKEEPDPADYGVWVPGIPVLVEKGLHAVNAQDWVIGLINDGLIAGVGAVLGFVPQMFVLFLLLAFLESCGYMSRIAFVLDRIFRKFGLSGKSFIPMLVGTGCGIPGIMASRTIENERDRRMSIMTTTFIPCGAKVPFIAMIAGAIFGGSAWIATSAYFIGMAAIILSGIILKKTKMFAGEPAPFVMELPAYHWPTIKNLLLSMWERGWSFIKKAGTVILLSTLLIWFTTYFGFTDDGFRMLAEEEMDQSILAKIGSAISWLFIPLGWGNWQAAVASITGLVAKENIVGTMGILYPAGWPEIAANFSKIAGYSFLVFNLLCAPCFAAIGAIKREMNNPKWTWFAIGYQCIFAYLISFMIYQIGSAFSGNIQVFGFIVAILVLILMLYMLFRPYKESTKLTKKIKTIKTKG